MTAHNNKGEATPPVVAGSTSQQLAALTVLTMPGLKTAWRRHYHVPPPKGMSRDLLTRFIAYRIQERAFGGLSKSTLRRLDTISRSLDQPGSQGGDNAASLKPGTKLVREWGGATHTVMVLEDGFEYCGQHYASLTKVAAVISGLHRSGPAFFGLKRSSGRFVGRLSEYGSEVGVDE